MFICDHFATSFLKLPDLKDPEAVQKFFLEEIQMGEEHLARGQSPVLCIYSFVIYVKCIQLHSIFVSSSLAIMEFL